MTTVDIDLGTIAVGVAVAVDRRRTGGDLGVVGDMKVGKKFAEVGSRKLKRDLDHHMFESQTDLVIVVRRNLQNHPLGTIIMK